MSFFGFAPKSDGGGSIAYDLLRFPSVLLVAVCICLILILKLVAVGVRRPPQRLDAPIFIHRREDHRIWGAGRFFSERWQFWKACTQASKTGNFSFWAGRHPVVGLTGETARKAFFEHKSWGVQEGYAMLFGMMPKVDVKDDEGEDIGASTAYEKLFDKTVLRMMQKAAMEKHIPLLIREINAAFDDLAMQPEKLTDPFHSMYLLVFRMVMSVFGCVEIARNPDQLQRLLQTYERFKCTVQPSLMVFPWLPIPTNFRRITYAIQLYRTFSSVIDDRKKTGRREDDLCQVMMDHGESKGTIVAILTSVLFAAQQNSAPNAAWVLTYMSTSKHWTTLARRELQEVTARHFPNDRRPLAAQLAALPLHVWESEFPTLYLCFRDSIRLHTTTACFRQNTGTQAIVVHPMDGKGRAEVVPPGWFATYHNADAHLNPAIYTAPTRWDPARYLPGRAEDKKQAMAFVGWGGGRHPCVGQRFARLEQNLLLALWLARFEVETCEMETTPAGGEGAWSRKVAPPRSERRVLVEGEQPATDFDCVTSAMPRERVWLRYRELQADEMKKELEGVATVDFAVEEVPRSE